MQDFRGKVAVVTGAASGLGRAMAERFAAEGARVVLADIEAAPLAEAEAALRSAGAEVLAERTDVSKASDVDRLAQRAFETFGAVHVLCSNAGVGNHFAPTWQRSLADWEWILGVNLWGVIHGLRAFLPRMLEQGGEGHVVNTASLAAIASAPFLSDYFATKHAVLAISEALHHELALAGARVRVSVLCPGFVNTRIMDATRNRPAELPRDNTDLRPEIQMAEDAFRQLVASSTITPQQVAAEVLDAIRNEKFYIFTHPEAVAIARHRLEAIAEGGKPEWRLAELLNSAAG